MTCPEAESRKWQGLIHIISFICVCVCICVCRGSGEELVSLAFLTCCNPPASPSWLPSKPSVQFRVLPQILGFQARRDCEIPQGGGRLSLTLISPGGTVCTWGFLFVLGGHRRRNLDTPPLQFFQGGILAFPE